MSVQVKPRVVTADRDVVIVAAVAGAGIIGMACFDPELITGHHLRRLLLQWECTDGFNVYALYRKSAALPPRTQAFLDFVRESFVASIPTR